ncbi:hypothetical protein E2C01_059455 [Portunus trituberculatus]|uniref:Uncharacterized protein n=1 Tax=Portunus trituberculatus TaxID=210409 RepID=A0A5B7H2L3_PORTR|nr:hypothetical protein [Portunus trituberculatus]
MLGVARRVCAAGQAAVTIMSKQPVSTSSYAMVKAIEELEKNPYFGKYAGKIAKFQNKPLHLANVSLATFTFSGRVATGHRVHTW